MSYSSRTRNSVLNFTSSIVGQLIAILMQFIVRTVFIRTLGKSYLGINGLFSNILSMLSLAEMGVGSAIVFKLYEPLAIRDEKRINLLMQFYKVVYRFIGIGVAVVGLCLIPFLPSLIKDYEKLTSLNIKVVFVFLIFLINSVSSYLFFAYKSAIIKADQKEYYINLISYVFTIGCSIVEIIFLYLFKNFELYVVIQVIKTILQNIAVAVLANKLYPFLKNNPQDRITDQEARGIFKDCGALFIYKMNGVVLKSTDNIILSALIGLDAVALYSNYLIFYATVNTLLTKVFNSVGHSIGNLHTTHELRQEYKVFEITMFVAAVLGGTAMVGVYVVADEFILKWIGSEWILSHSFSFLIGLEIYTVAYKLALSKYRSTYGLFRQGWARPLAGMLINIIVSICSVKIIGISGVLIGTITADWSTVIWYDPLILHKIGFGGEYPVKNYYLKFLKYTAVTIIIGLLDNLICSHVFTGFGWASVVVHAVICGITTPAMLILVSAKSQEVEYFRNIIPKIISPLIKKVKRT